MSASLTKKHLRHHNTPRHIITAAAAASGGGAASGKNKRKANAMKPGAKATPTATATAASAAAAAKPIFASPLSGSGGSGSGGGGGGSSAASLALSAAADAFDSAESGVPTHIITGNRSIIIVDTKALAREATERAAERERLQARTARAIERRKQKSLDRKEAAADRKRQHTKSLIANAQTANEKRNIMRWIQSDADDSTNSAAAAATATASTGSDKRALKRQKLLAFDNVQKTVQRLTASNDDSHAAKTERSLVSFILQNQKR